MDSYNNPPKNNPTDPFYNIVKLEIVNAFYMYKITGNYKVHTDKAYKVQNAPIYKKFSLIPSNLAS